MYINTNAYLPIINTIRNFFDTASEICLKFIGSEEETNWMSTALEDIKNREKGTRHLERISRQVGALSSFTPAQIIRLVSLSEIEQNWMSKALEDIKYPEKGTRLLERISRQVGTLSAFTPAQVIRLVSLLDQWIKREPDSQVATNYLCQEVAALIIKKDIQSFENFLQKSSEKNFAIQVIIQLVRERQLLPLDAVEDLKLYGIDPHTLKGQKALIEIAKLAVQQNGMLTSKYIKNYGIDASTPEGQQALIEIAKLEAQQNSREISRYIKNYGIDASSPEGQQALIEIAKLEAQQNGR